MLAEGLPTGTACSYLRHTAHLLYGLVLSPEGLEQCFWAQVVRVILSHERGRGKEPLWVIVILEGLKYLGKAFEIDFMGHCLNFMEQREFHNIA